MKYLSLLFVLFFFSSSLIAGNLEYTYHFNSPTVRDIGDFQVISFDNTLVTGKTGEPALPYSSVKLLLSPGEEAVSVNYVFEDETALDGIYNIYPQQPSRPISEGSDGTFHQDLAIYSSSNQYPANARGEFSTHFLNGHSFLLTAFTPVKYYPGTGTVIYYKKVTVQVSTRPTKRSSRALENLQTSVRTQNRVGAFAQNPDLLRSYPTLQSRDEGYQILIITPQSFEVSFGALQDLYLLRGLKSEIATPEFINMNVTGQDLQDKIRNYIIQEYQQNGIEYVLLGGDAEHIPPRGFYCYVQSGGGYVDNNIPADLYYSALDGNWNTDGDNLWAEIGEDDLLPDVAVARFPASNVSQLEKLIHKSSLYQDQPVLGELRDPLMAGEYLWSDPLTYGEDYLELLIGYHEDNGYVTDGIPEDFNFLKLYDHLGDWGSGDLIDAVNQGRSFIHHSGHANQTYVMRLDISQVNNATFYQANGIDHNYTLVYTHGCLCGAFDENDCIGEAMVCIDNFAVAGAFNSRYGWFNEGQTEGPSAHLHREFVDALYHDKECRIGMAHMISKIESSAWVNAPGQWEEGALRWCFYCCNILGDPALGVWTDEPMEIETDYPEEIWPETTSVPVTVTSGGEPVENASCVIMAGDNMLGSAVTDASGQAVISVPQGFYGISVADLDVSGYNCKVHTYPLSIMVGTYEMPSQPILMSSKPNPFNRETTLMITLKDESEIHLTYYLPSGVEAGSEIFSGKAGLNEVRPDVSRWPEGIIHVCLRSDQTILYHRLIHIAK